MYEHLSKFRPDELLVHETEHWLITVRPKQVTLGSCVLLLKRDVGSLGGLTHAEAGDLPKAAEWFETRATALFNSERFNYVAAMMKDPFVHLHAFPRYSDVRTFAGHEWRDESWPAVVEFKDVETSGGTLEMIRDALRSDG